MKAYDLTVVMPVYNEAEAIGPVLEKWVAILDTLRLRCHIRAYNDGSKDATGTILKTIAEASGGRVLVIDKPNSGHGPTILRGYREAAEEADWVFQIDSDDEMGPEAFPALWARREAFDFLVGRRDGRRQPLPRKAISLVSRLCVRLFYGRGVWDVNTPYRLMRAERFAPLYARIPADTFAPNVILSGLAARHGLRQLEVPVPQRDRATGEVSIKKWKLFKAALRSFAQTVAFAVDSGAAGPEGNRAWRMAGLGLSLLGGAFAAFLLLTRWRLALLPALLLGLSGLRLLADTPRGRRCIDWVRAHPLLCLCGLLGLGVALRVIYMALFPSQLAEGGQVSDYGILWEHAQTIARGGWPISKSWVTVLFYGGVARLFGPSLAATFAATLLLKTAAGCAAFFAARRWIGPLGALFWVGTLVLSPSDIGHTGNIATEHTYAAGLMLAFLFATMAYDCRRGKTAALFGVAFGLAAWMAAWSRGEGILLWAVVPGLFLLTAIGGVLPWRKAAAFLLPALLVAGMGMGVGHAVNAKTSGARTAFCSDDNLWPRLFGANVATRGAWNAEDKRLIWGRYVKDHPGVTWEETDYGVPVPLAAKCPKEVAPYVKDEIRARWRNMPPREMAALLGAKAKTVWLNDPALLNFPSARWKQRSAVLVSAALPTTLALCSLFFFGVTLLRGGRLPHPFMWCGLLFLLGNAALLCLTEAAPRYGFAMHLLLGIYAGGLVSALTGASGAPPLPKGHA